MFEKEGLLKVAHLITDLVETKNIKTQNAEIEQGVKIHLNGQTLTTAGTCESQTDLSTSTSEVTPEATSTP